MADLIRELTLCTESFPSLVLVINTGPQQNHSPEKDVAFSLEFTIRTVNVVKMVAIYMTVKTKKIGRTVLSHHIRLHSCCIFFKLITITR